MRELLLALLIVLMGPGVAMADSYSPVTPTGASAGVTTSALNGVVGSCYALRPTTATNPSLTMDCSGNIGVKSITCSGTPCGSGGGGGTVAYQTIFQSGFFPSIGGSGITNTAYNISQGFLVPGMVIGHLAITCSAFNAADVAVGNSFYNALDSTGLGGATITFAIVSSTSSYSSPTVLGTIIIPSSAQAGPYVTAGTAAVATPYTATTNNQVIVQVTGTNMSASQQISQCVPMIGT